MNEPNLEPAATPTTPAASPQAKAGGRRNPLEYIALVFIVFAGCWGAYVYINSRKDGFSWRELLLLGEKKSKLVAVTGQVFFNGEPMVDGLVRAIPADAESGMKMALGPLDQEGKFELLTDANGMTPGAGVGTYKLVLEVTHPLRPGQLGTNPRLPEKYYSASTTPVSITVTADAAKNHFVIKEEGEEIPPPGGRRGRKNSPPDEQPNREEIRE